MDNTSMALDCNSIQVKGDRWASASQELLSVKKKKKKKNTEADTLSSLTHSHVMLGITLFADF